MFNPFENYIPALFLAFVTAASAVWDLRTHKIPNAITIPSMLLALSYYAAAYGLEGFWFSVAGLCTGMALLILPYLMGGMGAGDAKLMGAVGAILGPEQTVMAFLYIAVMGCVYALIVVIWQRRRMKGYFKQLWTSAQVFILTRKYIPVESAGEDRPKVYYGIAIAVGTYLYLALQLASRPLVV